MVSETRWIPLVLSFCVFSIEHERTHTAAKTADLDTSAGIASASYCRERLSESDNGKLQTERKITWK